MLTTLIAFLVATGFLVTFHELGHYWAARWAGVRVLRFSVGFGRALWSRTDRHGTEWCIAPIPLGGYVKMLDAREAPVPPVWRGQDFGSQPALHKIIIVVAGPIANLVLAVLLYTVLFMGGVDYLRPAIGTVLPNTPAAMAGLRDGDVVSAVNDQQTDSWATLHMQLMDALSDPDSDIQIVTEDGQRHIPAAAHRDIEANPQAVAALGMMPQRLLLQVAAVMPDSPAEKAGLREGDVLVAIDDQPLHRWSDLVSRVRPAIGQSLALTVSRQGQSLQVNVTPVARDHHGQREGSLGVAPSVDREWLVSLKGTREEGLFGALALGVQKTWNDASLSLRMMYRMVLGSVSVDQISGPLSIAGFAGETAKRGLSAYLGFLALLSVSLGVLNLLPIPVLDGGHLLYHVAEWIKGSPVSERMQMFGQRLGLALLLSLMLLAIFNDFNRLFAG